MMGGGQNGGFGFSPRNAVNNWRAHPFQNAFSTGLNLVLPGSGTLASMGFNRYNNSQGRLAMPANNFASGPAMSDMGSNLSSSIWDRPVGGYLGDVQGGTYPGAGFNFGYQGGPSLFDSMGGPTDYGGTFPDFSNYGDALVGNTTSDGDFLVDTPHGHVGPAGRRDGLGQNAFESGVTNFNVGGSPVINGTYDTGDPNQAYYRGPGGMR